MKLKLDENLDVRVATLLRLAGHDVPTVAGQGLSSTFYYQYRQKGKIRAEALQQAQIRLRSLAGDTLSTDYKPHLAPLLEAKFKQAECDRKAAEKERDTYPKDSEAYLQWEQERKERAKLATRIRKAKKHLEEYCQKSFPFSDPVYWAGFICAGLH